MNNDTERKKVMRRCFQRLLLLVGILALCSPYTNEAHALFGIGGGDEVFDPTNFVVNAVTSAQMLKQVKTSDPEVQQLPQNLRPALNLPYYPLSTWELLLLAELAQGGPRPYSTRTIDYYHTALHPTYLGMYPGFLPADHYPYRY